MIFSLSQKVCPKHKVKLQGPGWACPKCVAEPQTALEKARDEVSAVLLDANERVERLLERLRSHEPKQGES